MPTDIKKNGHAPAGAVPPKRRWEDNPLFEYSAVDPVPVMLDHERHLLFTNRALKDIQRETGINPFNGDEWDETSRTPDGLAVLLWAGLRHEDPDLTIEQVDEWIMLPRLYYYRERLLFAYNDSLPAPDPAPAGEAAPAEATDGPNPEAAPTG